jgi:hypothetical protein
MTGQRALSITRSTTSPLNQRPSHECGRQPSTIISLALLGCPHNLVHGIAVPDQEFGIHLVVRGEQLPQLLEISTGFGIRPWERRRNNVLFEILIRAASSAAVKNSCPSGSAGRLKRCLLMLFVVMRCISFGFVAIKDHR